MSVELDGANNIVKTDTISEVTSANGVTIDGLNIKDSAITDYPKGITVADQWFLTANTAMAAGANDITSNLARAVSSPFGSIGSAMTESSGIFTFPSTGIYEVRASFQGDASDSNDSYQGLIQSTTDNSSYGVRAIAYN